MLKYKNITTIVKHGKTSEMIWILLDRHEVAGSIPARPTTENKPLTLVL